MENGATKHFAVYGGHTVADITGGGSVRWRYFYGSDPQQHVAAVYAPDMSAASIPAGSLLWYLTDRENSVLTMYKNDRSHYRLVRYTPFGDIKNQTLGERSGYRGYDLQYGLGIQWTGTRWHSPVVGRWLSEDPQDPFNSTPNHYSFVDEAEQAAADAAEAKREAEKNSWGNRIKNTFSELEKGMRSGRHAVNNFLFGEEMGGYLNKADDFSWSMTKGLAKAAWGLVEVGWHMSLPGMLVDAYVNDDPKYLIPGYHLVHGIGETFDAWQAKGANWDDAMTMTVFGNFPVLNNVIMGVAEVIDGRSLNLDTFGKEMTLEMYGDRAGAVAFDVAALFVGGAKVAGKLPGWAKAAMKPFDVAMGFAGKYVAQPLAQGLGKALGATGKLVGQAAETLAPRLFKDLCERTKNTPVMRSIAKWMDLCFAGDMLMLAADGKIRADQVREGDYLCALPEDDPNAEMRLCRVEEVFERSGQLVNLYVEGQVIRTTGQHPFCKEFRGWVPALELQAGDRIWTDERRWATVMQVEDTGVVEKVYNFHIAECHSYFVSAIEEGASFWAHNTSTKDYRPGGFPYRTKADFIKGEQLGKKPTAVIEAEWKAYKEQLFERGKFKEADYLNALDEAPTGRGGHPICEGCMDDLDALMKQNTKDGPKTVTNTHVDHFPVTWDDQVKIWDSAPTLPTRQEVRTTYRTMDNRALCYSCNCSNRFNRVRGPYYGMEDGKF